MKILSEVCPSEVEADTAVCKSDSGIVGAKLRRAHHELGKVVGRHIALDAGAGLEDFTVVCLMRSGLCFGMGVSDELDCPLLLLDDRNDPQWSASGPAQSNRFTASNLPHLENKTVILADAVLNTGKSMLSALSQIEPVAGDVVIAVNVVQEKMVGALEGRRAYAVRSSKNQFAGANVIRQRDGKGPDTGDRLFKTIKRADGCRDGGFA